MPFAFSSFASGSSRFATVARSSARDFAAAQRRVHNALTDVLRQLARETPLVCFVDDLQWGDPESVSVLAALTEPGSPPALVVVSFREEEAGNAAVRAYERAVQHQAPAPVELGGGGKLVMTSGGYRSVSSRATVARFRKHVSPLTGVLSRLERIDAVTPAILQETFKKYFPMNRYTVVTLLPEKETQ